MAIVGMLSTYHRMCSKLCPQPRVPSQLDVVIVRKEGAAGSHKDLKVRRSRVLQALQWLIENNQYFHQISLGHN